MYAPPGWIVKSIVNVASGGNGNGVRSSGIGVIVNCRTTFPASSRMTVPAGKCSASPGMVGVVTTVSVVVGDAMVIGWAMSRTGDQITNGNAVVTPAFSVIRAS